MSDAPSRRSFLRGLASLPLIGGGVTLIGQPARVAVFLLRRRSCPLSAAQILALHLRPREEDIDRLLKAIMVTASGEVRS